MSTGELATWISVVVAVVAVVVAVAIAVSQRSRKQLSVAAYTHFPIVSAGPLTRSISIEADGHRLRDPHLLVVPLRSTGNVAIEPSDFSAPLTITFVDAAIVDISVEPGAAGIEPKCVASSPSRIEMEPLLLNAGDGLVITALLDGCPHNLDISARIANCQITWEQRSGFAAALSGSLTQLTVSLLGVSVSFRPNKPVGRVDTHRRH